MLTIISAFVVSSQSTKVILSNLTSEEFTQGSPIACNFNIGLNSKYAGHFNPEDAANVEALLETNKLKGVNKNQNDICLELVNNKLLDYQKNPVKIIDLVLGKFYKTWRGPFHPIEAGASLDRTFNGSRNQIYYWIFTAISESMYLIICLMGFFACKIKKQDTDEIILFQCLLLGMVVTLLIVETMNKYSLHQTIGIFFCSVYCLRYSLELDFKKGD
ncbi:MAG: hypothetical protein RR623_08435 [Bacilli bacterium]